MKSLVVLALVAVLGTLCSLILMGGFSDEDAVSAPGVMPDHQGQVSSKITPEMAESETPSAVETGDEQTAEARRRGARLRVDAALVNAGLMPVVPLSQSVVPPSREELDRIGQLAAQRVREIYARGDPHELKALEDQSRELRRRKHHIDLRRLRQGLPPVENHLQEVRRVFSAAPAKRIEQQ